MNVENVDRIIHANGAIRSAYSQNSLIWTGRDILKHTVRFKITIPTGVRGSISIYLNGRIYRKSGNSFNIIVNHGDVIKVTYSLRDRDYKFFTNTQGINKGIVIEKNCDIWVGFNKLNEEIM